MYLQCYRYILTVKVDNRLCLYICVCVDYMYISINDIHTICNCIFAV